MFPLCFILDQNGTLTTISPNNAVSLELLAEIHKWYSVAAKQDDAVERLKLKTATWLYKIHSWTEVHYSRF